MNSCCSNTLFRVADPVFLSGLLLLGACTNPDPPADTGDSVCQALATPVSEIQGDEFTSPLIDSQHTVRGTITWVVRDKGIYIEDTQSAANPQHSRALFILDAGLARSLEPGQRLQLTGLVTELGEREDTLTALSEIEDLVICAEETELPSTPVQLPLKPAEREALEGMRINIDQKLTLTDVYNLARGERTLSSNGVLRVPTEVSDPGVEAQMLENENRDHALVTVAPGTARAMAIGSFTQHVEGLMGHNGNIQQLWLENSPKMTAIRPPSPPPAGGPNVRVVTSNLLNFFNGDGNGTGFPTERGANTREEFEAQSARIAAVMKLIQPDLLAVQELENDGFDPKSAAQSLLDLLNGTGNDDWAFIAPDPEGIGGDVITVGFFYRRNVLEKAGPPRTLDEPEFRHLSRQPLAQLFRDLHTGDTFLVAVNHLKSKGRCPESGENADRGDGQGCWNAARLAAVKAEIPWLERMAEDSGTQNVLVLGDMNAWRHEDPIRQFRNSGLIDLVEAASGLPQHSFLYWGQTGTLDYAFATPELARLVRLASIWHINADWPAGMDLPEPWLRASDHDPVIIDFSFTQRETSD